MFTKELACFLLVLLLSQVECSQGAFTHMRSDSSLEATECKRGYYLVSVHQGQLLNCQPCSSNCSSCENSNTCLTCELNYLLQNGLCTNPDSQIDRLLQVKVGDNNQNNYNPCAWIPGCLTCTTGWIWVHCSACSAGYYVSSNTCVTCPLACATCTISSGAVSCVTCTNNNFVLSNTTPKKCICKNAALVPKTDGSGCQACNSQIPNCATCALSANNTAICATCSPGYYSASTSCIQCPSSCSVCLSATNCSGCKSGFIPNGTLCSCNTTAGLFLNATSQSCQLCTTYQSNCLVCAYNSTNSSKIICSACSPGFYLSGTSTCVACSAHCLTCNSTACTACNTTFIISGSTCICNATAGLYLNSNNTSCLSCNLLITNCATCLSSSLCSVCSTGFYPSNPTTCSLCPSSCSTCTTLSNCSACLPPFILVSNKCVCNATNGDFLDLVLNTCIACSTLIVNCQTCVVDPTNSTLTNCQTCLTGYFLAINLKSCTICPLSCLNCGSATTCSTCSAGLIWNSISLVCECQTACQTCSSLPNCTSCDGTFTNCLACSPGSYLVGVSCTTCPSSCLTCSGPFTCNLCSTSFVLDGTGMCVCNNTNGFYFDTVHATFTCLTCSSVITNCTTCSDPINPGGTVCTACISGYYPLATTCLICPSQCLTCSNGTFCVGCSTSFIAGAVSGTCVCDNTTNFLNATSNTCVTCTSFVLKCQTCAQGLTEVECSLCILGYYSLNPTTCSPCLSPCSSCTSSTVCAVCVSPFVLNVTSGACICNATDQLFYSMASQTCLSCNTTIGGCSICIVDPNNPNGLICQTCSNGLYLSATQISCVACPSTCSSCLNETTCTNCSTGYTLSGGLCICQNACQVCQSLQTSCSSCTITNGSLGACLSCQPGTHLLNSLYCIACDPFCPTCSQSSCLTCDVTFTLIGTDCVCDPSVGLFLNGTTCIQCAAFIPSCLVCASTATITCANCSVGYYLASNSSSCIQCDLTCSTCTTSPTTCTSCISGLTLLPNNTCSCQGTCLSICSTLPNCITCTVTLGGNFSECQSCLPGSFADLNGSICSLCSPVCTVCESLLICSKCSSTFSLVNSFCSCDLSSGMFLNNITNQCQQCNTLALNCLICDYNINSTTNVGCKFCDLTFYSLNGFCMPCGAGCVTCIDSVTCLVCSVSYVLAISGSCSCDTVNNYFFNITANLCDLCIVENCLVCTSLTTCLTCYDFYFLDPTNSSSQCDPVVCGDGILSPPQLCDDGNNKSGDGCGRDCQPEPSYICSGSPSICHVDTTFQILLHSIIKDTYECNVVTLNFKLIPQIDAYSECDFEKMYLSFGNNGMTLQNWSYSNSIISYSFLYDKDIQNQTITVIFNPSSLNVSAMSMFPSLVLSFNITPTNNVPAFLETTQNCKSKQSVTILTNTIQYASYGMLILSALPCKIVGLQLFGVLQLSFFNLGNQDNINNMMAPMLGMKGVNGLNLNLDGKNSAASSRRLLATSTVNSTSVPGRVYAIGYDANFLRNCNLMLFIVIAIIVFAFVLYFCTYCWKGCAPTLHKISKRLIKQVLLTLILFNCFNFAYSAGLHFRYDPVDDSLYAAGTIAAVAVIIIPIIMAVCLMATQQEGFGEYKDKLKDGLVQKSYFVVTIIYRIAIGLYISSTNEDQLSSLIVLALSILFLVYNLVNLPFRQAYHNYRANICHITQFVSLFVTMYYRSMKSTATAQEVATIFTPAYIQLSCIFISVIVSLIVLIYEIYVFIRDCCVKKKENQNRKQRSQSQHDIKHEEINMTQENVIVNEYNEADYK